jgi:hypothetical protein
MFASIKALTAKRLAGGEQHHGNETAPGLSITETNSHDGHDQVF